MKDIENFLNEDELNYKHKYEEPCKDEYEKYIDEYIDADLLEYDENTDLTGNTLKFFEKIRYRFIKYFAIVVLPILLYNGLYYMLLFNDIFFQTSTYYLVQLKEPIVLQSKMSVRTKKLVFAGIYTNIDYIRTTQNVISFDTNSGNVNITSKKPIVKKKMNINRPIKAYNSNRDLVEVNSLKKGEILIRIKEHSSLKGRYFERDMTESLLKEIYISDNIIYEKSKTISYSENFDKYSMQKIEKELKNYKKYHIGKI